MPGVLVEGLGKVPQALCRFAIYHKYDARLLKKDRLEQPGWTTRAFERAGSISIATAR
jgi:hypothetical protein